MRHGESVKPRIVKPSDNAVLNGLSSADESAAAAEINPADFVGFSRGRQSLEHSVWYNGWLMTFLATGEDTNGQFALIEATARKDNVPPPHIHHREDEIFYVLEGAL